MARCSSLPLRMVLSGVEQVIQSTSSQSPSCSFFSPPQPRSPLYGALKNDFETECRTKSPERTQTTLLLCSQKGFLVSHQSGDRAAYNIPHVGQSYQLSDALGLECLDLSFGISKHASHQYHRLGTRRMCSLYLMVNLMLSSANRGFYYFFPAILEQLMWDVVNSRWFLSLRTAYGCLNLLQQDQVGRVAGLSLDALEDAGICLGEVLHQLAFVSCCLL